MWYVGLDWADTHHDVVILDEAGRRVGSQRFAHSPEGLNELKQLLLWHANYARRELSFWAKLT